MQKYNLTQRILHWAMALIIIFLLIIGFLMQDFPGDIKYTYYGLHKSLGVLILIMFFIRGFARIKHGAPALPKKFAKWEVKLSHAVHHLLYLLMFLMPLSGWIMSNAKGHSVKLFMFKMPDLVEKNKVLGDFARDAHGYVAWLLIAILVLHFAGVVKHLVLDKENILKRMV